MSSPRRLALVRHGPTAPLPSGWADARAVRAWREAYETEGLVEGASAPDGVAALAGEAGIVVASDAPRALDSARLLARDREVAISPLLRELDLEVPDLVGLRLPFPAWALAIGARKWLRGLRGAHPSPVEASRLDDAVAWLDELSRRHALVVAVTHASFRAELATRLERAGWARDPDRRSLRPWSAWSFRR